MDRLDRYREVALVVDGVRKAITPDSTDWATGKFDMLEHGLSSTLIGKEFELDWTHDGDDQYAAVSFITIRYESCDSISTWTSAQTSPATFEVYGGTYSGSSADYLKTEANHWHSSGHTGDRGVKVTFNDFVTISRFEGTHFKFFTEI